MPDFSFHNLYSNCLWHWRISHIPSEADNAPYLGELYYSTSNVFPCELIFEAGFPNLKPRVSLTYMHMTLLYHKNNDTINPAQVIGSFDKFCDFKSSASEKICIL